MGTSRHRRHGVQRERPRYDPRGTDGRSRRNVRGIRPRARRLTTTIANSLRRLGLGLLVGAVLHGTAEAQVRDTARTKRDTVRSRADTVTSGRDTSVKRDTTGEVRVLVPPREDT